MKASLSTDRWEADVLKKLGMLMDGAVANYDAGQIQKGKPGSIEPHGDSLYQYHEEKLKKLLKAPGYTRRKAIAEAEADYFMVKKRPPTYNSPDSDQNREDRDKAIIAYHESGWDLYLICAVVKCSDRHVEKLLKKHYAPARASR